MKNFVNKNRRILIAGLVFIFATTLVSVVLADVGLNVKIPPTAVGENAIYGQIAAGSLGSLMVLNNLGSSGHGTVLGNNEVVIDKDGNLSLSSLVGSDVRPVGVNSSGTLTVMGSAMAVYVGFTGSTHNGQFANGYADANTLCNTSFAGSHVCTTGEILNSINIASATWSSAHNVSFWISNGPPAFTANANDCIGWTSAVSTDYGALWNKLAAGDGFGSLDSCDSAYNFACCK